MKNLSLILIILAINISGLIAQNKQNYSSRLSFLTKPEIIRYWKTNGVDNYEGVYYSRELFGELLIVKVKNGYQMFQIDHIKNYENNRHDFYLQESFYILEPTADKSVFLTYFFCKYNDNSWSDDGIRGFIKLDGLNIIYDFGKPVVCLKTFPTKFENIKINSTKNIEKVSGSGFAISSTGIIVTNYHVVENGSIIKVRGLNSTFNVTYNAKVLIFDKNSDLCLIQIDDSRFTSLGAIPYTLKADIENVGENIFILGYPLRATMGDEIKLINGIISSKTGFQGDISTYQTSAPVHPGNSGGPLFNSQGVLIGVINAKHAGVENTSYAVKSIYLKSLIESLSDPIKYSTVNTLIGKNLIQQVEIIKKYVYIIEVE